jgi:hypothetical protein
MKTLGLTTAIAGAVVAGSVLLSSSAEAATLQLKIGGSTVLDNSLGSPTLNFDPTVSPTGVGTIVTGTDSSFGVVGSSVTLRDVRLLSTGINSWQLASPSDGSNFITGLLGGRIFNLNTFNLFRTTVPGFGDVFNANFSGSFAGPAGVGIGELITGQLVQDSAGFNITVTEIPTPALLPGLLALGAGALRKRKAEAVDEG